MDFGFVLLCIAVAVFPLIAAVCLFVVAYRGKQIWTCRFCLIGGIVVLCVGAYWEYGIVTLGQARLTLREINQAKPQTRVELESLLPFHTSAQVVPQKWDFREFEKMKADDVLIEYNLYLMWPFKIPYTKDNRVIQYPNDD